MVISVKERSKSQIDITSRKSPCDIEFSLRSEANSAKLIMRFANSNRGVWKPQKCRDGPPGTSDRSCPKFGPGDAAMSRVRLKPAYGCLGIPSSSIRLAGGLDYARESMCPVESRKRKDYVLHFLLTRQRESLRSKQLALQIRGAGTANPEKTRDGLRRGRVPINRARHPVRPDGDAMSKAPAQKHRTAPLVSVLAASGFGRIPSQKYFDPRSSIK